MQRCTSPGLLSAAMALRLGAPAHGLPPRRGPFLLVLDGRLQQQDAQELAALKQLLLLQGLSSIALQCQAPKDLQACSQFAAGLAASQEGFLIGIGGDALALQLARAAWTRACPLGLLARGPGRHLAHLHGLPQDLPQAVQAWQRRLATPVAVGLLNGEPFFAEAKLLPAGQDCQPGLGIGLPWRRRSLPRLPATLRIRLDRSPALDQVLALQASTQLPVREQRPSPAAHGGLYALIRQGDGAARLRRFHSAIALAQDGAEEPSLQLQLDGMTHTEAGHAALRLADTPLLLMRGC